MEVRPILEKGCVRCSAIFEIDELDKVREGVMNIQKVRDWDGKKHVTFITREKYIQEIALYTEAGVSIKREPEHNQ